MMKYRLRSIRARLMLIFSITFLGLFGLLYLGTRLFIEDYYVSSNMKNMEQVIDSALENGNVRPVEMIPEIERMTGANVDVFEGSGRVIGYMPTPNQNSVIDSDVVVAYNRQLGETPGSSFFDMEKNDDINASRILYVRRLDNGNILIAAKAMGFVQEALRMYFAFMQRASVVVFIIGIIILFFITRWLTKPIIEMNKVTLKMANLDFDHQLLVQSEDEIGQLKNSINSMAHSLSTSIDALTDVNAQLEIELSKERSLEKMSRRFVSDVSHELKNPLASMMSYTDGLIHGIPKTEETKQEYYQILLDETNRMNRLVKDLLDLSAYESGSYTLNREAFALGELVFSAKERFDHLYNRSDVSFKYEAIPDDRLYADRSRINQVIVNLLSNAYKHVDHEGQIQVHLSQENDLTSLNICNTGKEIPKEERDKIWQSFYQVETENQGNGLGLSIVKSIIELHGGTCRCYVTKKNQVIFNCFEVTLQKTVVLQ